MARNTFTTITKLIVGLLVVFLPRICFAQTVIDKAIEASNPCSGLQRRTLLGTIGIDNFKEAHIENANVALNENIMTLSLMGHLACRTSDAAAIKGDAKASIKITGEVSLQDCSDPKLDVSLYDFGGTFGSIISVGSRNVEESLRRALTSQWKKACETLLNVGK